MADRHTLAEAATRAATELRPFFDAQTRRVPHDVAAFGDVEEWREFVAYDLAVDAASVLHGGDFNDDELHWILREVERQLLDV